VREWTARQVTAAVGIVVVAAASAIASFAGRTHVAVVGLLALMVAVLFGLLDMRRRFAAIARRVKINHQKLNVLRDTTAAVHRKAGDAALALEKQYSRPIGQEERETLNRIEGQSRKNIKVLEELRSMHEAENIHVRRLEADVKVLRRRVPTMGPQGEMLAALSDHPHHAEETFDINAVSAFEQTLPPDTQEEFVSAYAIENAYLKGKHLADFKETPLPVPTAEEISDDEKYEAVREYLHLTAGTSPKHLVLTNDYPDYGQEYANGFVHQRVQAYRAQGNEVDVISFKRGRRPQVSSYYEVPVLRGYFNQLVGLLAARTYQSISVHFLNPHMWNALLPYLGSTNVHVFVHGYEIRHWSRVASTHSTPKALSDVIERTHQLQAFWRHVATAHPGPVTFCFVAEWMRSAAQVDMEIVFLGKRVEIVHNYIDTELFQYVPKPPAQRFNILWLRSAHAHNYAADLAVRTLRLLKDSSHWDALSMRIIGGGQYFQQFFDEFGGDDNVHISETFVPQDQISEFHRQYGLFLIPTRLDSQGVSRDEAMASGLVPVTNATTAVPEFVDDSCAILAPPEDSVAMARGIEELLDDPARFSEMSRRAAQRVRGKSSAEYTILREAQMMGLRIASPS